MAIIISLHETISHCIFLILIYKSRYICYTADRESTYNVYIPVFSAISDYNIPCNPLILRRQLNRSKKSFTLNIRILFHLFLIFQTLLILIINTKETSAIINTDRKYLNQQSLNFLTVLLNVMLNSNITTMLIVFLSIEFWLYVYMKEININTFFKKNYQIIPKKLMAKIIEYEFTLFREIILYHVYLMI